MRTLAVMMVTFLFLGCSAEKKEEKSRSWAEIVKSDTLRVITTSNSTSFFFYRGAPLGFEYEALEKFAKANDLELDVEVARSKEEMLERFKKGEADIVAGRLFPAREDVSDVTFTKPLYLTPPAVVQRVAPPHTSPAVVKIASAQGDTALQVKAKKINNVKELSKSEVHVPDITPFERRLVEISDSISGDIEVVEVDAASEKLIRAVALGKIDFAVVDKNLADLTDEYYTNIKIAPVLGPKFAVAWGTRDERKELAAKLNEWLQTKEASETLSELYEKYFIDRQGYKERIETGLLNSETGKLSDYDTLFKDGAKKVGWDWKLLAAQAYQESEFNPRAKSWAGAEGLLQLMPATARQQGVKDSFNPQENVDGAIKFIQWLQEHWSDKIPDPHERLKFVLASYNTGAGHVEDARRLATKHGNDPNKWEDVSYWLLQKSKKEVYQDPVVEHGFSRGLEPVTYVAKILDRYDNYQKWVK